MNAIGVLRFTIALARPEVLLAQASFSLFTLIEVKGMEPCQGLVTV
jgi:hypothetical protein